MVHKIQSRFLTPCLEKSPKSVPCACPALCPFDPAPPCVHGCEQTLVLLSFPTFRVPDVSERPRREHPWVSPCIYPFPAEFWEVQEEKAQTHYPTPSCSGEVLDMKMTLWDLVALCGITPAAPSLHPCELSRPWRMPRSLEALALCLRPKRGNISSPAALLPSRCICHPGSS